MSAALVLEVEHLSVHARGASGPVPIVEDVSFQLEARQLTAIVGESGAGKSMSIRAALGLLDRRVFTVGGRIVLGGVDLDTLGARDRRRCLARWASLVPQSPTDALNPTMKVGWQIAEAMWRSVIREQRLSRREAASRSVELMRAVGIADPERRFHSYPHELSGGMNQRVVIAIALSCDSSVLFCDEPTSALDVTTQATIMDLLEDLRASRGLGIVLVTHNLALAADRADEVVVVHGGRVVEVFPARALAQEAAMPYTRMLVAAARDGVSTPTASQGALRNRCSFETACDRAEGRCRAEVPALEEIRSGHRCRCFFPVLAARVPPADAVEAGHRGPR